MRQEIAEQDRCDSRYLALKIGSALTAAACQADPAAVLASTGPVLDWLLGGPDNSEDRHNRRRAAGRHLANLTDAASRAAWAGSAFAWPGPAGFVAAAGQYYAALTGNGDHAS
jgi:hypothetical protein